MIRRPLACSAIAALAVAACSSDDTATPDSAATAASASTSVGTAAPVDTVEPVETVEPETSDAPESSAQDATGSSDTSGTNPSTEPDDTAPAATTIATDITTTPPSVGEPLTIEELLTLPRPIVLSHAGGEDVHPHSTPYAYAKSVAAGVDMLDFDVRLTSDGVLVVHHDETVDRTTNGTGAVASMTYGDLLALDNGYWFTEECVCTGRDEGDYLHRGIRTGDTEPPSGYVAEDFVVPRLRDIVVRFPSMPLNIEIKTTGEAGIGTAQVLADELAELDRLDHAVVTSFDDAVNDAFRGFAPDVEISPGLGAASRWVLERVPLPHGMRILQLPPEFQGIEVLTPETIAASQGAGYPIWVWPNDRALEDESGYGRFLRMGLSGLNANDPAVAVDAVRRFVEASEDGPPASDVEAAAIGAQMAIDQGDSLGDCPYGPTGDLVAALPETLPLAPGFATAGVEENGQVFTGGDVDITYCVLTPDDGSDGPLDEIRLDVSPGADVEIPKYLAEEFTDEDVDTAESGSVADGDVRTGCWDDGDVCGAFRQGDGLFIAAVLSGEETQRPADAALVIETLVPIVIERLAARAT